MNSAEKRLIEATMNEHRRSQIRTMFNQMKQYNVIVSGIDGRKVEVEKGHWVVDFASCNYLGLDLDSETSNDIDKEIKNWGVHPSWCRLVASPGIYDALERELAELIGTETTLIIPTVTLISISVLPALVGKNGVLILDKSGHETMYEGAKIARDSGATLESFRQDDFETLETMLKKHKDNPRKVIMVDGVYSMSGDFARIPELVSLAKKYDAILYIDDAHGFGIVGENPTSDMPYGFNGNGIVKYYGLDYENIIYVGGCSKAYSSMAAFVGCSHEMKTFLQAFATTYDLSGPCPTASLSTLANGLKINKARGDQYRKRLWELTNRTIKGLRALGYTVFNKSGFPIVYALIGDNDALIDSANMLYEKGILVTVSPYPMVIRGEEGHRITLTAANTHEEVDQLLAAFSDVKDCLTEKRFLKTK
ncbi:MAG: pyridoxal phosphate-dependent aminotransferase family protein [Deltaproteobacteria bacterium]|nr:pyridoxal phosphate-dependent aminotransferase family protein [Deltaproteobacteria bacterium]